MEDFVALANNTFENLKKNYEEENEIECISY